jgi:hypothetical protein
VNKLDRLLQKYRTERDRLDFLIQTLERDLKELLGDSIDQRRRRKGPSIVSLAEKVLAKYPDGLLMPALLLELRKLGYESKGENPANTVNSVLHRASDQFMRLTDGRWILEKFSDLHRVVKTPDGALKISNGAPKAES